MTGTGGLTGPESSPDQAAIRLVVEGYAAAVDDRDAEALSAVCGPGFHLDVPAELNVDGEARTHTDPAAVVATLESFVRTRHSVDRVQVAVNGDEATGVSLCTAHHLYRKRDGTVHDFCAFLRYHDTFARTDGLWLLAARRLELEWSTDHEVQVPAPAGQTSPRA